MSAYDKSNWLHEAEWTRAAFCVHLVETERQFLKNASMPPSLTASSSKSKPKDSEATLASSRGTIWTSALRRNSSFDCKDGLGESASNSSLAKAQKRRSKSVDANLELAETERERKGGRLFSARPHHSRRSSEMPVGKSKSADVGPQPLNTSSNTVENDGSSDFILNPITN